MSDEATWRRQASDDALEIEHLTTALDSRTVIGIAIGRLMERYDMDRDQALATLKRLSQQHNRKLRDLAADLADGAVLTL